MTSRDKLRLLLIQAREEEHMRLQDIECFLERCRLNPEQVTSYTVMTGRPEDLDLPSFDAVMIGGAGRFSATYDYPWMDGLLAVVQRMVETGQPLFGSCWGHQVIARALGGEVISDGARAEMGCMEVTLTEAGRQDGLFGAYPETFKANMGHKDRVSRLPASCVELARNASQPNQAFRVVGKPVYGTQFHSELDAHRERERLVEYRDAYLDVLPTEVEFNAVLDGLAPTTEVDALLGHFLDEYVLGGTN